MSVTSTHPDYTLRKPQWERCRDLLEGKDRLIEQDLASFIAFATTTQDGLVIGGKGKYVMSPSGLTLPEYHAYLQRAAFFNATSRSLEAFIGLIQAKPATIDYPESILHHIQDVTNSGVPLREFVQSVLREEFTTSQHGILVDYSNTTLRSLTASDNDSLGFRPYLTHYKAENILDWRTKTMGGREVLYHVRLREEVLTVDEEDEFAYNTKTIYRVLDLTDEGTYQVRIFNEDSEQEGETIVPLMGGQPLQEIPFYFVGGTKVRKPIMLDMVDTNIAHYRNSADYEHGLHFTALPTPVITGINTMEGEEEFRIGSLTAWVLQQPDAKAFFLEFEGKGLDSIKEALKDKEFRMAVLGARMLSDEKRASEAEGTVALRTAGERSILYNIASDVSDAIRKALRIMAVWAGQDATTLSYALNVDYGMSKLTHQQLTALISAWQKNSITGRTLFENLQRGDIISPDERYEDYKDKFTDPEHNFIPETSHNEQDGVEEPNDTDVNMRDAEKE